MKRLALKNSKLITQLRSKYLIVTAFFCLFYTNAYTFFRVNFRRRLRGSLWSKSRCLAQKKGKTFYPIGRTWDVLKLRLVADRADPRNPRADRQIQSFHLNAEILRAPATVVEARELRRDSVDFFYFISRHKSEKWENNTESK